MSTLVTSPSRVKPRSRPAGRISFTGEYDTEFPVAFTADIAYRVGPVVPASFDEPGDPGEIEWWLDSLESIVVYHDGAGAELKLDEHSEPTWRRFVRNQLSQSHAEIAERLRQGLGVVPVRRLASLCPHHQWPRRGRRGPTLTEILMRRREMILTLCGAAIAPVAKAKPIDFGGGDVETDAEVAEFFARSQLHWMQQQHPADWRERYLLTAMQWSPEVAVLLSVGKPDHVAGDFDFWLTEGLQRKVLASYRTPCGRAWSIVVEWEMSKADRRAWAEFSDPTLYSKTV